MTLIKAKLQRGKQIIVARGWKVRRTVYKGTAWGNFQDNGLFCIDTSLHAFVKIKRCTPLKLLCGNSKHNIINQGAVSGKDGIQTVTNLIYE